MLENGNRQPGQAPAIVVCAAVIRRAGKVLLCTRPEGSHLAGMWEFPGGKLHPGESESECLVREIHEELSVGIIVLDRIFRIIHPYPGKTVDLRFLRAFIPGDSSQIIPREGQKAEWFDICEIRSLPVVPADAPFMEFLCMEF